MSTASSTCAYFSSGDIEDENVLITDFWLEFVAARDERGRHSYKCALSQEPRPELHSPDPDRRQPPAGQERTQQDLQTVLQPSAVSRWSAVSPSPEPTDEDAPARPRPHYPAHPELPEMAGPFARGRQFVSNCLRDSFVLDVLEKMS